MKKSLFIFLFFTKVAFVQKHYAIDITYTVKSVYDKVKKECEKIQYDTTKVVFLGCSSGEQMDALIGKNNGKSDFEDSKNNVKISSKINTIVDIEGILAFKNPESKEGIISGLLLGGSYEEKPLIWQQASPLTHTDNKTPPALYINNSIDRFHAGRDDMIAILNKNEIYNEVQIIKNSAHSF